MEISGRGIGCIPPVERPFFHVPGRPGGLNESTARVGGGLLRRIDAATGRPAVPDRLSLVTSFSLVIGLSVGCGLPGDPLRVTLP